MVSLFRTESCECQICDEIRRFARAEMKGDEVEARIRELNVELSGASESAALDAVVRSALNGLKTLRDHPDAARVDREKYAAFFGAMADRMHLNTEQARRAVGCLGLPVGHDDAPIVTLRDGSEAMLQLPSGATRISLRHLVRQVREDSADLVLMLAGLRRYGETS